MTHTYKHTIQTTTTFFFFFLDRISNAYLFYIHFGPKHFICMRICFPAVFRKIPYKMSSEFIHHTSAMPFNGTFPSLYPSSQTKKICLQIYSNSNTIGTNSFRFACFITCCGNLRVGETLNDNTLCVIY